MDKMRRMKELIQRLNDANRAYYQDNHEIMTNLEYDALYDELLQLEQSSGIVLTNSPTETVEPEVVSTLTKVEHSSPMLSLDKTKGVAVLETFLADQDGLLSWKLDGLTLVLRYEHGHLIQAITRGNGSIGEDVTHNAKVFTNLPLSIPFKGRCELRGESVISNSDFEKINEAEAYRFKNPRNLCSGTIRQLDSAQTAKRMVGFFAFALINAVNEYGETQTFITKHEQLDWLLQQGFDVVAFSPVTSKTIDDAVNIFKSKVATYPLASDGLVLTFDNIIYSESLGSTSKFPKDSLAFKWQDEISTTTFIGIEWNTSRTGLINPVAVFEPVNIEGSTVSRASVHNVSILKHLELIPGDRITVYKANMIIPQIAQNKTKDEKHPRTVMIPAHCPVCKAHTEIVGEPELLYCLNPNCAAQKISALTHFVSRDAMNIAGLSEQTLDKFVSMGFINNYYDIFHLDRHQETIRNMDGFGEKSYDNLIHAIEKSKDIALPNFINALGIHHVGLANAKLLCAAFDSDAQHIADVCRAADHKEKLLAIKGFGEAIAKSLHEYFSIHENMTLYQNSIKILRFITPTKNEDQILKNLTFVVTGDVSRFKNRKALSEYIETHGGKLSGSVSQKTSFLINNDNASESSKNKKANELGIKILTEDDFINQFFDGVLSIKI